ncbi:hypothetical protein ACOJUR_12105 [Alicyclobacillus tolerans]|uniref:hypothetical protein n=1 Tax=Alicyclobacillus tolerans TaxID=90970 RepID=UPI003B7C639B
MSINNPFQTVYTGNNVQININGQPVGLVNTLTITRGVNRRAVYAVGSPLFVDAPVTQASVTVTATAMVPFNADNSYTSEGINPSRSLTEQLNQAAYSIDVINSTTGEIEYSVVNAYYNQDSVQVPDTDVLTLNLSWIAQDTAAWS